MRLLRILPSLDPRGGGPMEGARNIDSCLASKGVHVEVLTLDSPDAGDFLHLYPATVHALGPSKWGFGYNSRLVPWLREHGSVFDAVIVDGLWQYHGFGTWRALAGSSTPYFVLPHGMLDPWFKYKYPLKHLKKWLYWPWAEYRLLRDARAVVFTCDEERRLARDSFWLYRCNEVVTSYGTKSPPSNAQELTGAFLQKHPELSGKRLLLFLSRIHEKKGCDLLLEAFARFADRDPTLHLVMAGPDQTGWVATLQQQANALGVAHRITWPGMLTGNDKWGAFHAAEVFCLPSHQENFGIVVAEALGCGKPVLISNKVNIWREIEGDRAGIVNDDTLEGTVAGLAAWLAMTPEQQEDMRLAARNCFEQRFQIEQVAESLIRIISEHVGPNTSAKPQHLRRHA